MYHVRQIPALYSNIPGKEDNLQGCVRRLLKNLNARNYTGHEATNRVRAVLEKCDFPTRELLIRILNRDARCGVNVKLVNNTWPGLIPTHDVMLAQKVNWKKLQYPCISTIKIDGVRALATRDVILTRAGKRIIGLEHLQEQIPKNVMLDGELIIPNMNFQQGCGRIRSYDECPTAQLWTFDVPGMKEPFLDRISFLEELSKECEHIDNVPYAIAESEQEVRGMFSSAIRDGYEGLVVKPLDYKYVRKRSPHWMKVKAMDSYDLKVTGMIEGEGKYRGMLGALVVDFKGKAVRVGTGFSDEERDTYWRNNVLGRLVEVECHELTPDGSMRHPRFKGFRDDKDEISHD